jgi:glyoxylase-like metal-dependent hydrolase (beta-lactamase superfamily II)
MKISLLHPATFKLDGGAMFGIVPKPIWSKKITPDEFNRINMSLRIVLIQTINKNILIDTGIGQYHGEKFNNQFDIKEQKDSLIGCLKEAKLEPQDITDIILTHLHFDHVGGLTDKDGGEVFKNATLHLSEKHLKYAISPSMRDAGSFHSHMFKDIIENAKKENRLNFINSEEDKLVDGDEEITFKISFGHTPYMIHPIFKNYIYMADLVPMSHHIHIPWVMGYDIEPATTTKYKKYFYNHIIKENLTMIFEHDIETWGSTLSQNEKGKFTSKLAFNTNNNLIQKLN